MDDKGGSQGDSLAEAAREQNSKLRRLIDVVGALITASRELMKRLQLADEAERAQTDEIPADKVGGAGDSHSHPKT